MKKLLLISLAIFLAITSINAQDEKPREKYVYCELLGTAKFLSTKVTVTIDYGQNAREVQKVKDANGKNVSFNSMVDAMNYMGLEGWEFVQAYAVTIGNQNVYHWLLKKSVGELNKEQIDEALKSLRIKND